MARSARLPGSPAVSATEELCEKLGRLATSDLRLTSALASAAEAVGRTTGASFVEMWIAIDELNLASTARWPAVSVDADAGPAEAAGARIAGLAIARDEPTVMHIDRHPRALAHERARTGATELSQIVGFPLRARGAPVGVVVVGLTRRTELSSARIADLAAPLAPLGPLIELNHDADALDPSWAAARRNRLAMLGLLTAGFVHDVNNAFTVILGSADALATGDTPSPEVAELKAATAHGARLARSFLRTLTPTPGTASTTDVAATLAELEPMIRLVAGRGTRVELDVAPDAGLIPVERSQFEQAILNLAANAGEAAGEHGLLTITVSAPDPPGQSRRVRITVTDSGAGMDAATLEQIFTPFFTTKPQGTGLGLLSVRRMVDEGGGELRVDSEPDRGTTFELDLPRAQAST